MLNEHRGRKKIEIFAAPINTDEWRNTRRKRGVREEQSLATDPDIKLKDAHLMSLARVLFAKAYELPQVAESLDISESDAGRFRETLVKREQPFSGVNDHRELKKDLNYHIARRGIVGRTKDTPLIMMGTTPSGPLHLGNMYSIVNGLKIANDLYRIMGAKPRIVFGFNDFTVRPDQFSEVPEREEVLSEFLKRLGEFLGTPVELQLFSELQRTDRFRRVLSQAIYSRLVNFQEVVNGEYRWPSSDVLQDRKDYRLISLAETIGIRAAVEQPDLYVLGGDHRHAEDNFSIGRRLNVPDPVILRMGILYALSGKEMHASAGNSLPYSELRDNPNLFPEIAKLGQAPRMTIGPAEYLKLIPPKYKKIYGQSRPKLKSA